GNVLHENQENALNVGEIRTETIAGSIQTKHQKEHGKCATTQGSSRLRHGVFSSLSPNEANRFGAPAELDPLTGRLHQQPGAAAKQKDKERVHCDPQPNANQEEYNGISSHEDDSYDEWPELPFMREHSQHHQDPGRKQIKQQGHELSS